LGLAVVDAGHQGTEQIMSSYLCSLLNEESKKLGFNIDVIYITGKDCMQTV